ncbi:MAG: GIY-YIG nuclease family protein [bacterium]|nr:GIY-YIG nuclease family protein [bacterium]
MKPLTVDIDGTRGSPLFFRCLGVVMKERVYSFLADRTEGVPSEEIVAVVLRLQGAKGLVAEKIVKAAVEDDPQFVLDANGGWSLQASETPLRAATFVTLGFGEVPPDVDDDLTAHFELAGRRVQMEGPETAFPGAVIGEGEPESEKVLSAFSTFLEGGIPVAFRLPRLVRSFNELTRFLLGRPIMSEGICLHRLGRRRFPDRALPSLDDLAEALGLTFLADRNAEAEASLQAEVLLQLLEWCEKEGQTSVDSVISDLYPDSSPVRFESYAFDADFLKDLPQTPGVYVMRDRKGQVIYVGKAVNLRERVGHYFARRSERPEKTQQILDRIWSMEVEMVGSELEALILESELIRLCEPEFNTQVAVHERQADLGSRQNFVLILPSADPDSVELFCVRAGFPIEQVRVRQDLSDWQGVSRQVVRLFFESEALLLKEGDRASWEILKSWVVSQQDRVNVVDMERTGPQAEVMRVLSEYISGCEVEGWEKVWRV